MAPETEKNKSIEEIVTIKQLIFKKSIHIQASWTVLSPIPIYLSQAIGPALEIYKKNTRFTT